MALISFVRIDESVLNILIALCWGKWTLS